MKVLRQLVESRDAKQAENERDIAVLEAREAWEALPVEERGDEPVVPEDCTVEAVTARNKEIDELDERIKQESKAEKRSKAIAEARALIAPVVSDDPSNIEVANEKMVYGPDSEFSYYEDLMRTAHGFAMPGFEGASSRLQEWAHQVEREVAHGSKVGKVATDSLRTHFRGDQKSNPSETRVSNALAEIRDRGRASLSRMDDTEWRSIVTGGGATAAAASGGAAFVSPAIFLDPYAPFREYGRAFADACHSEELPDWGQQIYVPHVTGPAGVAQQTEGQAVNETDPTFGYLNAPVITLAGQVVVSQQQLDRSGPAFAFDRLIFDQLMRDYTPKWDAYVLTTTLATATTQIWSPSGGFDLIAQNGAGGFYGQISKAKASIRTTNGTVLNPTHLFLTPQRWELIAGWGGNDYRPVVVDNMHGPYNAIGAGSADGDEGIEGYTGYRLNGLPVCTDANIPSFGTTSEDSAIVGDLQEVFVYEGSMVNRVVPQTLASDLLSILQLYCYVAVLVRYQAGIVQISGTGMTPPVYSL